MAHILIVTKPDGQSYRMAFSGDWGPTVEQEKLKLPGCTFEETDESDQPKEAEQ